ncbi:MAG: polyprenol monophosphomannose synthase [Pirellulales bacterium]|nr:polyprenol monophosphomannose synthase [Pirellulales bacterium]
MIAADDRLLVVIPTYNERANLPALSEQIFAVLPDCELLIVDDTSPDGTGEWCRSHENQKLRLLSREGKEGIGSALLAGLRYANAKGYRWVVTMDADFSHAPSELPQLVSQMDHGSSTSPTDVTIASRYIAGGSIEGWGVRRQMMSRLVNWFARWFLGLGVRDCSTGFRCYRMATLRPVLGESFFARGYAFEEEILFRLQRQGATFQEIPSRFVDRDRGGSKLNIAEAFKAGWVLLRLALGRFWPCSTC